MAPPGFPGAAAADGPSMAGRGQDPKLGLPGSSLAHQITGQRRPGGGGGLPSQLAEEQTRAARG